LSNNTSDSPKRTCNQCGCDLILKKTRTEKTERSFASITVNTYICSNKECQDEIDKKTAKRIELRNEQELARQRRLEKAHLGHKQAPIEEVKAVA